MESTTQKQEVSAINQLAPAERAFLALSANHNEQALVELAVKYVDATEIKDKTDYRMVMRGGIELMKARVSIEKTGKAARDDANRFRSAVIDEQNRLIEIIHPEENRLRAMRRDYDEAEKRAAEEARQIEQRRIADITERIQTIKNQTEGMIGADATAIQMRLDAVSTIVCNEILFAEFTDTAIEVKDDAIKLLATALAARVDLEEQQAAQQRVAEEQADRQAELDRQAQEQLEREAAAQAKIDADMADLHQQQKENEDKIRAQEEKEKVRVAKITSRIQGIRDMVHLDPGSDPDAVRSRELKVVGIDLSTFSEFSEQAREACVKTIQTLNELWQLKTDAVEAEKVKDEKERLERETLARELEGIAMAEQEAEAARQEALMPEKDKLMEWAVNLNNISGPAVVDEELKRLRDQAEHEVSLIGSNLLTAVNAS